MKEFIEESRKKINVFLKNKKQDIKNEFSILNEENLQLLFEFTSRGKALRGALVIFAAKYFEGGDFDETEALLFASTMEMIQSYLLIHDDIMDKSLKRRGGRSINTESEIEGDNLGITKKQEYGIFKSICIGDLCSSVSNYFLSLSKRANKASFEVSKSIFRVIEHQIEDLKFGYLKDAPLEKIVEIYKGKTGEYTFYLPFSLGINSKRDFENGEEQIIRLLSNDLGILFQIKDDILNLYPTTNEKDLYSDIKDDKKTLIRHILLQNANKTEKESLLNIFGKPILKEEDIILFKEKMEKYDVVNQVYLLTQDNKNRAEACINTLSIKKEGRNMLLRLLEYCTERKN